MANATADYGFVYVSSPYGIAPELIECAVLDAADDIYIGDPIILTGTGDAAGRPSVTRAGNDSTTNNVFGVVQGILATGPDNLHKQYSSGPDTILVMPTLPGVRFRVNPTSTGLQLDDIGQRFDHVQASGDTVTGKSGYSLKNSSGSASDNTWLLLEFDRRPDNVFSSTVSTVTADVDAIVICVESVWANGNGA